MQTDLAICGRPGNSNAIASLWIASDLLGVWQLAAIRRAEWQNECAGCEAGEQAMRALHCCVAKQRLVEYPVADDIRQAISNGEVA